MIATLSEPVPLFSSSRTPLWFAVRTKLRGESIAAAALQRKGWECLLPAQAGEEAGSALPVFDRLVFCRFDWRQRLGVLAAPGVVSIVGQEESPAVLDETELGTLRRLSDSGSRLKPWPYTAAGPRVQILAGPLEGLEGYWAEGAASGQLILSLHAVRRSAAVDIDDQRCVQVAA